MRFVCVFIVCVFLCCFFECFVSKVQTSHMHKQTRKHSNKIKHKEFHDFLDILSNFTNWVNDNVDRLNFTVRLIVFVVFIVFCLIFVRFQKRDTTFLEVKNMSNGCYFFGVVFLKCLLCFPLFFWFWFCFGATF